MNKILRYTYDKVNDMKILSSIRWSELIVCLIGFMVGRINITNGWNPLSVAYIGAVYQSSSLRRWNSIFTILGILSVNQPLALTIKYIGTILLIYLIRWYMEGMNYKADLISQTVVATGSAFVISIIIIVTKGFTMYDFIQSLMELIFIFAFIVIYDKGVSLILERKKTALTNQEIIGATVILVSVIGGMVELYIEFAGGNRIYIRDLICFFIIILVSYLGDGASGAAMGTVIGTLLVMIGYIPPHLISIYALSGLGGSLIASLGKLGTAVGVLSGHMIGIYFVNDGIIDFSLLGAYTLAVIIFFICPKDFFGFSRWFGDKNREYEQEIHMRRVQELTTSKLEGFASAFKNLAKTFNVISEKKVSLSSKDVRNLFEDVTNKACQGCGLIDYCWEKDFYNTYQAAYDILAVVEHKNKIAVSDISKEFKDKCIRLEAFVQALDQTFELYKQDLMWKNRIAESRELISGQLDSVASIIGELSSEIKQEIIFKRDLEKEVREELASKGIKVEDLIIILSSDNKYDVTIVTRWNLESSKHKQTIVSILNSVIGKKFEISQYSYSSNEKEVTTRFKETCKYGVASASANIAKVNNLSGDQHSAMEISNSQYLLALSDGMGSGMSACNESTATIELLEEFIESGFEKEVAIKMINSVLILKSGEETFSTMDMAIIDMHTGITEFIKMGSATTFIKRKGYVEHLDSSSLPVGILNNVEIESQKIRLEDGDMIIMVSDGILDIEKDKFNQKDTFVNLIEELDSSNPQYIADSLLEKSQDLICGEIDDDMTIVVGRIWEKLYKTM